MKNLTLSAIAILFSVHVFAQTSATSEATSSSRTSISTSVTNKQFSLTASFDTDKEKQLKTLIANTLGKPTENTKTSATWTSSDGYTVILRSHHLLIDVDKTKVSEDLYKSFERLKTQIQSTINAQD
ncbi:Uncharacterised protein [Sphingobacterium spiritivorum]|uniref:Uncharacterized protein n=1 Tax=Sphingobacterium spiritivorum TaxID=258 RepID=A0A380CQ13_SPHSI|nr:hypothetical protein [Sphingobacterium spiritivorum]SUJ24658.1 Uncharacterised protein [Sphingobacterium spiritivorum]